MLGGFYCVTLRKVLSTEEIAMPSTQMKRTRRV